MGIADALLDTWPSTEVKVAPEPRLVGHYGLTMGEQVVTPKVQDPAKSIRVSLLNLRKQPVTLSPGMKIARSEPSKSTKEEKNDTSGAMDT